MARIYLTAGILFLAACGSHPAQTSPLSGSFTLSLKVVLAGSMPAPAAGAKVFVTKSLVAVADGVTDSNGSYAVGGLNAGDYSVSVSPVTPCYGASLKNISVTADVAEQIVVSSGADTVHLTKITLDGVDIPSGGSATWPVTKMVVSGTYCAQKYSWPAKPTVLLRLLYDGQVAVPGANNIDGTYNGGVTTEGNWQMQSVNSAGWGPCEFFLEGLQCYSRITGYTIGLSTPSPPGGGKIVPILGQQQSAWVINFTHK